MKKYKVLYYSCASRGRNPENPSDRTSGIHVEQRLEVNPTGIANCITTVEKDCYVLEVDFESSGTYNDNVVIVPYDDYNSRIPQDTSAIGSITTTIGHSALRNGWKIIEIRKDG